MQGRETRWGALRHWQAWVGIALLLLLVFAGEWAGFSWARDHTFAFRTVAQIVGGVVGCAIGYSILSSIVTGLVRR